MNFSRMVTMVVRHSNMLMDSSLASAVLTVEKH